MSQSWTDISSFKIKFTEMLNTDEFTCQFKTQLETMFWEEVLVLETSEIYHVMHRNRGNTLVQPASCQCQKIICNPLKPLSTNLKQVWKPQNTL